MTSIVLAFAAAFLFGLALVLAQVGLRYVAPLSGAAIAIPSSTALFICVALVTVVGSTLLFGKVEGGLQLALGVALLIAG